MQGNLYQYQPKGEFQSITRKAQGPDPEPPGVAGGSGAEALDAKDTREQEQPKVAAEGDRRQSPNTLPCTSKTNQEQDGSPGSKNGQYGQYQISYIGHGDHATRKELLKRYPRVSVLRKRKYPIMSVELYLYRPAPGQKHRKYKKRLKS